MIFCCSCCCCCFCSSFSSLFLPLFFFCIGVLHSFLQFHSSHFTGSVRTRTHPMILVLTFSTYCLSVVVRVSHTSIFSHIFNITFFIFFSFLILSCLSFSSFPFCSLFLSFFLFCGSVHVSMFCPSVRYNQALVSSQAAGKKKRGGGGGDDEETGTPS